MKLSSLVTIGQLYEFIDELHDQGKTVDEIIDAIMAQYDNIENTLTKDTLYSLVSERISQ